MCLTFAGFLIVIAFCDEESGKIYFILKEKQSSKTS